MIRLATAAALAWVASVISVPVFSADWAEIEAEAQGQTVYFNAWGGSDAINRYIAWAAEETQSRFGVTVEHVKIDDTAAVVARILAEQTAGRTSDGTVDLIWVNGENFRTLKSNGLLYGPWTQDAPNYALVDTDGKPTTTIDFGEPVDNLEAPWGMAQLVFMHDTASTSDHPTSMSELLAFAKANPGRVTYPNPPNFHGTTFIKQALLELTDSPDALLQPAAEADDIDAVLAPLWGYLDALHPHMWRGGENHPKDAQVMRQMLDDGEIDISLSFNPNEASRAIAEGQLADTVRTYIHTGGTLGNTHFVAVPFNSSNAAGAKVFANFLMSANAQAEKANPDVWGDPSVLAQDKLSDAERALFDALPLGIATLSPAELSPTLPEPHASWVSELEARWQQRYGG
ncbi:MAG: ABC transporter substrate-binding protein [Pseudomonadota bacterium]